MTGIPLQILWQQIIDRNYPPGPMREIYLKHARQVADLALDINRSRGLGLDPDMVEGASMTHDIGICDTNAPGIHCRGEAPYIRHGVIGAAMLRKAGAPEEWARVAERHTGTGITREDIMAQNLDLPDADYMPVTLLEKLVCYADKFYSKTGSMERKPMSRVRNSIARHGGDSLERFDRLREMFGDAD